MKVPAAQQKQIKQTKNQKHIYIYERGQKECLGGQLSLKSEEKEMWRCWDVGDIVPQGPGMDG